MPLNNPIKTLQPKPMKRQKFRPQQGSMLVLMIAFTATIVLALLFFALGFVRLTGTQFEQKTAIEAAALAAAREMSNIVVVNTDFGYVGLSDSAPVGTDTTSGDNYYNQVHGINTLMGTTLLDYIIGKSIDDDELKNLAGVDHTKAIAAADQLQAELQRCTTPGQTAVDKDGNVVNPYLAAENAYRSNQVRIAGKSNYKANSMKLELGTVDSMSTNIKTPSGWGGAFNVGATKGGYYLSYKPVRYDGKTWVFAGIGDSMRLLDPKKYKPTATGVPYQHRTIVRAEAVQELNDNGLVANTSSVAVAQPASVYDPKPAPGALVVSFPDGPPDGACAQRSLSDLYVGSCLADGNDNSDVYIAANGDYPVDVGSTVTPDPNWPIPGDPGKQANNACKIALYDWIKRAGTKADVAAVIAAQNHPYNAPSPATVMWPPGNPNAKPIPNGVAHIYKFTPAGTVFYQSKQIDPAPFYVISDQQMLVESFEVLTNGAANDVRIKPIDLGPPIMDSDGEVILTKKYDLFIRDYGRRPGKLTGGKHSGEPIDDPLVSYNGSSSKPTIRLSRDGTGFGTASASTFLGKGAKSRSEGGGGSGALPMILPQEDFAFYWTGSTMSILRDPGAYKQFQAGSGVRSTYRISGVIADIRFRRQLKVRDESTVQIPVTDPTTGTPVVDPATGLPTTTPTSVSTKSDIGYIGLK